MDIGSCDERINSLPFHGALEIPPPTRASSPASSARGKNLVGIGLCYDYGEVRGQLVYENQFNLPYHPMIVLHSFQRIAQVEPEFFGIRTMWNSCPFAITALVSQLGTFRRRGGLFF